MGPTLGNVKNYTKIIVSNPPFLFNKKYNFFFGGGWVLYVFLTPPALPKVPEARFNMGQTYSLSSLAFKRVTHGRAFTSTFSLPLLPQVHEGATGHLEQTNNQGNLVTGTPI